MIEKLRKESNASLSWRGTSGKIAVILGVICALSLAGAKLSAQSERGDPEHGRLIYEQNCLRCHGQSLDGNGPDAPYLILRPADLTSPESRAKTDWELLVPIYHGVMFTPMHGWRGQLSYDDIRDVLSYIRTVAPFDAVG